MATEDTQEGYLPDPGENVHGPMWDGSFPMGTGIGENTKSDPVFTDLPEAAHYGGSDG